MRDIVRLDVLKVIYARQSPRHLALSAPLVLYVVDQVFNLVDQVAQWDCTFAGELATPPCDR